MTRRSGCSISCRNVFRNSAPLAPSMTRWSHDIVTFIRSRTTTWRSTTTGRDYAVPTARMAEFGGLMIAVNSSMPHAPRFEIVNVEP